MGTFSSEESHQENISEYTLNYKSLYTKKNHPMVLSISSGKGGVGKTLTVVNLALFAQKQGHKVLIIDGDLGMANVDIVLGLVPRYNIRDVLNGQVTINDIMLEGPQGIKIIPSGSGISSLQQLTFVEKQLLSEQLSRLKTDFDLYFIDTGAGIGDNVINLNLMAHRRILVTTSEPHAMTDVYAMMKVFSQQKINRCDLIVNMAKSAKEGEQTAYKLKEVAQKFLNMKVNYLGNIPYDQQLNKHLLRRDMGSIEASKTISAQAWSHITREILSETNENFSTNTEDSLFKKLINVG
jgi:flagellar biosynthesis protein FlhG